jgi:hypothetical protein
MIVTQIFALLAILICPVITTQIYAVYNNRVRVMVFNATFNNISVKS